MIKDTKKIRSILLQLRADKNVTQKEVSNILKTVPQTLGKYESGTNVPGIKTFIKILDYYGYDLVICKRC